MTQEYFKFIEYSLRELIDPDLPKEEVECMVAQTHQAALETEEENYEIERKRNAALALNFVRLAEEALAAGEDHEVVVFTQKAADHAALSAKKSPSDAASFHGAVSEQQAWLQYSWVG